MSILYSFSAQSIHCISSKPIVIQDEQYSIPIPGSQKIVSSTLEDTVFALVLFDTKGDKTKCTLNGGNLLSYPLFPFCTFPMTCTKEGIEAEIVLEIVPSSIASSCKQSTQIQLEGELQNTCYNLHSTLLPVLIEDTSLVLPHSPLSLQISQEGYSFYIHSTEILLIPFSTIEKSSVKEKQSIGRGICTGVVEMVFNCKEKPYSDWIRYSLTYQENHVLWELLNTSPQLTSHKGYFFVSNVEYDFIVGKACETHLDGIKESARRIRIFQYRNR